MQAVENTRAYRKTVSMAFPAADIERQREIARDLTLRLYSIAASGSGFADGATSRRSRRLSRSVV